MVVLLSCPNLIFVAAICLPPKTLYALVQAVLRDPEVGPCRPPNEFLLICDLPSKRSKMLSPEKTIRVKNDNMASRYILQKTRGIYTTLLVHGEIPHQHPVHADFSLHLPPVRGKKLSTASPLVDGTYFSSAASRWRTPHPTPVDGDFSIWHRPGGSPLLIMELGSTHSSWKCFHSRPGLNHIHIYIYILPFKVTTKTR